jgi:hypothetical protein
MGVVAAISIPAAIVPASAGAATISVTPSSLQAGGDPSLAITGSLAAYPTGVTGTPQSLTVTLPPGALASASANPSCLQTAQDVVGTAGTGCEVATGTVSVSTGGISSTLPLAAWIAPPPANSGDVAGLDVGVGSAAVIHGDVKVAVSGGAPVVELVINVSSLTGTPLNLNITGLTLNVSGTLNGNPLTRLPDLCSAGTANLTIAYTSGSDTGSATITPTGCSSLTYAPSITESATRDTNDAGIALTAEIKQSSAITESSTKTVTISFPTSVIGVNVTNALAALNSCPTVKTGCTQVGTATITSPVYPGTITGALYGTGTATAPYLAVVLPAPYNLTLYGGVSLATQSVTFAPATSAFPLQTPMPDLPIGDLKVLVNGGSTSLFNATCAPTSAPATAAFGAWSGASANPPSALTVTGCPPSTGQTAGAPTASGASLTGLVSGKAKLKFSLAAGKNAPLIKSFNVKLPKGLSFISKGLKKGLKVSGKYTAKISGGQLVVTLKTAESSVSVTVSSKALSVSKALSASVKKKKTKTLNASVGVTDAKGKTTSLTLAFAKLK